MGITNIRYGLEDKIGRFRGELEAKRLEIKQIETGMARLTSLLQEITELEDVIKAAEKVIIHDHPDWKPDRVKAIKPQVGRKLFKTGEMGRTALALLREAEDWTRPRLIAHRMLVDIGEDADDRSALDKLSNSVGAYFKAHEGDLVESQGDFAKEWRVIRGN